MRRSLKKQYYDRIARRNARRVAAMSEKSKWDDVLIDNDETLNILDPTYIKLPNGELAGNPLSDTEPPFVAVNAGVVGESTDVARADHSHDLVLPSELARIKTTQTGIPDFYWDTVNNVLYAYNGSYYFSITHLT